MIQTASKAVGIAGMRFEFRFRAGSARRARRPAFEWIEWPDFVAPQEDSRPRRAEEAEGEGAVAAAGVESGGGLDAPALWGVGLRAIRPGRGRLRARIGRREFTVPAVVFRPREFFLCMVLSSNYHYGWDPLCYLFGGTPENLELEGDAWPKLRQLERMYHQRGLPITWLIDEKVAAKAHDSIRRWRLEFGDDYGVMPTSFIHHSAENYNVTKSQEEVTALVRETRRRTEAFFDFYTATLAIDQFIGSVGSKFTEAAYQLGFECLWGVGFDHRTCDTSMFHRGCPWDIYKPDRGNFRIPAGHPARLWMVQWTARDALLSFHSPDSGPSGAVIFSTDPDDQRASRIMFEQPDYWRDFFRGYRGNFPPQNADWFIQEGPSLSPPALNDAFCFLMHQEDHDCHFPENADLLRRFLDATPGEATPATLDEVAAWLNLRYGAAQHPAQMMLLEDHLRCHESVVWYGDVQKPADWPAKGEKYPPGIVYYDANQMWCASEGEPLPWRFFDFTPRTRVAEEDVYPESNPMRLARVLALDARHESSNFSNSSESSAPAHEGDASQESRSNRAGLGGVVTVRAQIESEADFAQLPLILWNALPEEREKVGQIFGSASSASASVPVPVREGQAALAGRHIVLFIDVRRGETRVDKQVALGPLLQAARRARGRD